MAIEKEWMVGEFNARKGTAECRADADQVSNMLTRDSPCVAHGRCVTLDVGRQQVAENGIVSSSDSLCNFLIPLRLIVPTTNFLLTSHG